MSSHFDERSGVVKCVTDWGCWWQTYGEVFIQVNLPPATTSKEIKVKVTAKLIECSIRNNMVFSGELQGKVKADETVWTLEDKKYLEILLVKGGVSESDSFWPSLLIGQYVPDPLMALEMRKKLDLEKYQIENPGFDFSGAELDKCYD